MIEPHHEVRGCAPGVSCLVNDRALRPPAVRRAAAHGFYLLASSLPLPLRPLASCRLVKRALPSPVPIVSTPQWVRCLTLGSSLRPCTTASLCITTTVSC